MIKDRNIAPDAGIDPSKILGGGSLGVGEVFYVAAANTDQWNRLKLSTQSGHLFTDIQSALDATVANRNDYVIVMPSNTDYDLTAALTMSKNRVHLICPAGIGNMGMNNFARIHQNTATTQCIVVTADCIEIAGLFFKGYDGTAHDAPSIIHLSGTRWTAHIHDNFFGIGATASSANYGILADGACSHFNIHDNYFTNYAPGALTSTDNDIAAFIGITSASSTRGIIARNIMHTGSNTAVATGISCAGAYIVISDNIITADQAHGAAEAGALTLGISSGASSVLVRNVFPGMAAEADIISGATADLGCVLNYSVQNGGTIVDADTSST